MYELSHRLLARGVKMWLRALACGQPWPKKWLRPPRVWPEEGEALTLSRGYGRSRASDALRAVVACGWASGRRPDALGSVFGAATAVICGCEEAAS